jgi:GT2 family glycosyltransferase
MSRPSVDVVVPFAGSQEALEQLVERLGGLRTGPDDSITVVDNRAAGAEAASSRDVAVLPAREVQSSYFARNRGAERGRGDWLLFIDADVEPSADLVERYFDAPPSGDSGVLAGAVVDEPADDQPGARLAVRYAHLRRTMTQENTLGRGRWGYAQTANCAVRRAAFESVGGFRERVRSGGDADLCFRLAAAGWKIERRDAAVAIHRSRPTLRKMFRQRARHGSGAAWLDREHPGSFPRKSWLRLAVSTLAGAVRVPLRLATGRSDGALLAFVDPLTTWAFELGRLASNDAGRPPGPSLGRPRR